MPIEVRKTLGYKSIENDRLSDSAFREFLDKAFRNMYDHMKDGCPFYIWYASCEAYNFIGACQDCYLNVHQEIVWNKSSLVFGRQDYHWKHEPCLYGWKDGAHYFIDDRTQTTVIDDEKQLDFKKMKKEQLIELLKEIYSDKVSSTVINEDKPAVSELHPTMKPIKLIARLVKNSSRKNEIVLDLFGGSGTTIITCEQLGRKCYMMEHDPEYTDIIIRRWEQFTGKKAVKIK